jgi:hypothetical protein
MKTYPTHFCCGVARSVAASPKSFGCRECNQLIAVVAFQQSLFLHSAITYRVATQNVCFCHIILRTVDEYLIQMLILEDNRQRCSNFNVGGALRYSSEVTSTTQSSPSAPAGRPGHGTQPGQSIEIPPQQPQQQQYQLQQVSDVDCGNNAFVLHAIRGDTEQ